MVFKFTPYNQRNSTPICGFMSALFFWGNVRGRYNILNDILRLFEFLKYLLPPCRQKEKGLTNSFNTFSQNTHIHNFEHLFHAYFTQWPFIKVSAHSGSTKTPEKNVREESKNNK